MTLTLLIQMLWMTMLPLWFWWIMRRVERRLKVFLAREIRLSRKPLYDWELRVKTESGREGRQMCWQQARTPREAYEKYVADRQRYDFDFLERDEILFKRGGIREEDL
jgi:hypothetical protein